MMSTSFRYIPQIPSLRPLPLLILARSTMRDILHKLIDPLLTIYSFTGKEEEEEEFGFSRLTKSVAAAAAALSGMQLLGGL